MRVFFRFQAQRRFLPFSEIGAVATLKRYGTAGGSAFYQRRGKKGAYMEEQNRKKVTLWIKPDILSRMDGWLEADNCKGRGEFTERALRFYMGYLATEDTSEFLSRTLVTTIQGTMEANTNRICRLLFKLCVELGMAVHTVAAHFKADHNDLRALRGFVVNEVKRTNGDINFDRALEHQRKLVDD